MAGYLPSPWCSWYLLRHFGLGCGGVAPLHPFLHPPTPQMAGYCLAYVLLRGLRGAPVWGWEDEQDQSLPFGGHLNYLDK